MRLDLIEMMTAWGCFLCEMRRLNAAGFNYNNQGAKATFKFCIKNDTQGASNPLKYSIY